MRVWDKTTLITNWLIAISLIASFITLGEASDVGGVVASYHIIALSILFTATTLRCVWTLIGTQTSHISNMVRSPSKIIVQLYSLFSSRTIVFVGHSPIGGLFAATTLGVLLYTAFNGLFFVAPDGTATPAAIFFGYYFTLDYMAEHNLLVLASMIMWAVYAFSVFVKLFLNGTNYGDFIYNGEENIALPETSVENLQKSRYFTSGFATYALSAILFAVVVIPSLNTMSEYVEFNGLSSLNYANVNTGDRPTHFVAQRPVNWAEELANVQTAAGEEERLNERLEREIYELENLDLTHYKSDQD